MCLPRDEHFLSLVVDAPGGLPIARVCWLTGKADRDYQPAPPTHLGRRSARRRTSSARRSSISISLKPKIHRASTRRRKRCGSSANPSTSPARDNSSCGHRSSTPHLRVCLTFCPISRRPLLVAFLVSSMLAQFLKHIGLKSNRRPSGVPVKSLLITSSDVSTHFPPG